MMRPEVGADMGAEEARGRHGGTPTYVRYGAKIAILPTLVESTTFPVESTTFEGGFELLSTSSFR